ncbi:MAG: cobalamin-dependent protein [Kiritimatiellae bacterium]|nr:cobalamin-dependent protein [Kiritimatiellia bacterium]
MNAVGKRFKANEVFVPEVLIAARAMKVGTEILKPHLIDAGVDVSPEKFVQLAKEHNAHIVGLSALLTTTMPSMKAVVDTMRGEGVTAKIIIGGAPVTQGYCDTIGADDGYSADAAAAAELALSLIGA